MRCLTLLLLACAAHVVGADEVLFKMEQQLPPLPIDGSTCGRTYEGIGALINSDAAWLKAYPETQRSQILDILFKPNWAASLQVLKLEVGGDGHSTINTESSHMHTEDEPPSFRRGWILWVMQEAKKRNPALRVGGLAWSWPSWTKGSVDKKVRYLTEWVEGIKTTFNVTMDFMGLQNEGAITGGPANFSVALRRSLDAAGFAGTLIECCDAHDFSFLSDPGMRNHSSEFFQAVDALAVHEPLRGAEAVPAAALESGKRIWSSESWQSYANSDGGGCWARAVNWGWVKGNLTRHMAWNLIQTYPANGGSDGLVYDGHGLMWAEVPWAGHFNVNSPIWISAHYTQASAPGWALLPVGAGSGMLPGGGSYISLVSQPGACGPAAQETGAEAADAGAELTIVLQAMTYELSKCFKDSHPPWVVSPAQNVSFKIAPSLLRRLQLRSAARGDGTLSLSARRTSLFQDNVDDAYWYVPSTRRTNCYFEPMPAIVVSPSGEVTVEIAANQVLTLSTLQTMSRGDGSAANDGLPLAPNSTAWPAARSCANLSGLPVDSPLVEAGILAMDQQGVWEAGVSRDPRLQTTTMQQVVVAEPDEWHSGSSFRFPQTFVGPIANFSAPITVSCRVLPPAFATGWAGIGVGGPSYEGTPKGMQAPGRNLSTLAVWVNRTWQFLGHRGQVVATLNSAGGTAATQWFNLSLTVQSTHPGEFSYSARIDGSLVATGDAPINKNGNKPFAYLASAYSGVPPARSNAEFRELCLQMVALLPTGKPPSPSPPRPKPPGPPRPPPTPGPPTPAPPSGPGLSLATCNASEPRQQWTFSGEDRGEAGTLRPSANSSACLDASVRELRRDVPLRHCRGTAETHGGTTSEASSQSWHWNSTSGRLSSVLRPPCHVKKHGVNCSRCLDQLQNHPGVVDLFDCKSDANQVWEFTVTSGASPMRHAAGCLSYNRELALKTDDAVADDCASLDASQAAAVRAVAARTLAAATPWGARAGRPSARARHADPSAAHRANVRRLPVVEAAALPRSAAALRCFGAALGGAPFVLRGGAEEWGLLKLVREAPLASTADARALHAAMGWREDWRHLEFRSAKPHEGLPQQDKSQTESASALGAVFSASRSTYAMVRISEDMWQRMVRGWLKPLVPSSSKGHPLVQDSPAGRKVAGCLSATERAELELVLRWRMLVVGNVGAGMENHFDTLPTASWHLHLRGEKLWTVCSPRKPGEPEDPDGADAQLSVGDDEYDSDSAAQRGETGPLPNADCFEGMLQAGEVIYYGKGWYHETECFSAPTITVSGTSIPARHAEKFERQMMRDDCAPAADFRDSGERFAWGMDVISKETCAAYARCHGVEEHGTEDVEQLQGDHDHDDRDDRDEPQSEQELLGGDNGEHEPGHGEEPGHEESLQEDFEEEEIEEGSHDHSNRDEL